MIALDFMGAALIGKSFHLFEKVTDSVAQWTNRIGAGALALMMFLTTADVCLRYIFSWPLVGAYEITEFMMATVVVFGLAYAVPRGEHISIDLLFSLLCERAKALISSVTTILSVAVVVIVGWRCIVYAESMRAGGYVSQSLSIPIYPFVYVVAFGFTIFSLTLLLHLRKQLTAAPQETGRWAWAGLFLGIGLVVLLSGTPLLREIPSRVTPFNAGLLGIGLLVVFAFSGMHLGAAMGLLGLLGMVYVVGLKSGLTIMGTSPYSTVASYSYSVIPLFILMGTFCFHSGLSKDLYYTAHKFVGHLPGGLAMATVGACTGFAAVSGSGMATVATMGKVALPEMRRYNYDMRLASGSIAAGGSIGILIPPSTILVIYGILTQQSIGKLFLAGFIPGVLEAFFYMIVIAILCKRNPLMGPRGPRVNVMEKVVALKSTWGVAVLFLLVIGGIYFGIFTPTEAAGVGAFGALLLTFTRRQLTWQGFASSLNQTVTTTAVMFFILIGAMIFASFLAVTRLPFELSTFVAQLSLNRYAVLGAIIVLYLFIGAFLDIFSIVVLTIPIIFPVIQALHFDPIWFGIIVVRLFEMGAITPPIGINVFILKGVAKDIPLTTIYRGIVPFFVADLFHVGLLIIFPKLVTFLPNMMR